jgi:hypothetical protein
MHQKRRADQISNVSARTLDGTVFIERAGGRWLDFVTCLSKQINDFLAASSLTCLSKQVNDFLAASSFPCKTIRTYLELTVGPAFWWQTIW